jgi:hypothetical protein
MITHEFKMAFNIVAKIDEKKLEEQIAFRVLLTKALLKLASKVGRMHISIEVEAAEVKQ